MQTTRHGLDKLPVASCELRVKRRSILLATRNSKLATSATAFTLIELLVVIGIIVILIGILLPVINKIRYAAYSADTKNEISQISNACNQYYTTFHAFPGPLSNDYVEGVNAPLPGKPTALTAHPLELYNPGAAGLPATYTNLGNFPITGSENLVLGLMGGLRLDMVGPPQDASASPTIPYKMAFSPPEVGLGPLSLNPVSPGRTPSFFPTGSTYLVWCQGPPGNITQSNQYNAALALSEFTDQAQTQAFDSPIPEFVDRFPTPGPLPILYLRARTGASGVVSDGTNLVIDPTTGLNALYQYDVREIAAYTVPSPSSPGGGTGIGLATTMVHNLQAVGSPNILAAGGPPSVYGNLKTHPPRNAGPYFFNPALTPTNTINDRNVNHSGRPRAVDQFILISAGPDGIYGTADDITSFGDVSQ